MNPVFILATEYPSDANAYAHSFLHPRSKGYVKAGFDIKVINFAAAKSYIYEGIRVLTAREGEKELRQTKNAILISHAPNIRKHILFLLKNRRYIYWLILFFHGHEILYVNQAYPKPYSFNKKEKYKYCIEHVYDRIKIPVMRMFLQQKLKKQCDLIFVSQWMLDAQESTGIKFNDKGKIHIINNGISEYILEANYSLSQFRADFITIRPLDRAKYSIDLVVKFAEANPQYTFHIYGKGKYFDYNSHPDNVKVINEFIFPKDMPALFNSYKCAIMPTRTDAQGLMMCEMATYGIPILTSDIPVCHEMLDEYSNVRFIKNDTWGNKLETIPTKLEYPLNRFSFENTIQKEINLIYQRCNK